MLRGISNVGMEPFRSALRELGLADVESYGMSGNLLFTAVGPDRTALEERIASRVGTIAIVRTCRELAEVVAADPFRSSIMFLTHPPSPARRRAFLNLEFEEPPPVLSGTTVFFVYPARLRGRKTPVDFERALGRSGTARSSRIVQALVMRMSRG